jgi:drug/metabolite transporter (DMT)-like permease
MAAIVLWTLVYDVVVAASILLLGNPSTILGNLTLRSLLSLLLDWRFLLGAILAVGARFMFVIINNLASKHEAFAGAHLSVTALATMSSVIVVLLANHFLLGDKFSTIQLVGVAIVLVGFYLIFQ